MHHKQSFSRSLAGVALLVSLVGLLAGCGSAQTTHPASTRHPETPAASPTLAATATPSVARVPYPWPMQAHTNAFNGQTFWAPSNPAVDQEMTADFLSFWTWGGYSGPTTFPFTPDTSQITLLATADESGQLQSYVSQLASSQQVTAYVGVIDPASGRPAQTVRCTDQTGLVCNTGYAFVSTTKTMYNTETGAVVSTAPQVNIICMVTQQYSQELHRWQVSAFQIQEVAG